MEYQALSEELVAFHDEAYRAFHLKLVGDTKARVLGVRMPQMRKLAKKYRNDLADLLSFPNEIYEVILLKCLVLGLQDYETYTAHLGEVLPLIDNWAICDCFDAPCIKKHRADFLQYIKKYRYSSHVFTSRYALVQLLKYYCEEEYLPVIFESVEGSDHSQYYIMMAAAWLTAEVLVKHFEEGVRFLKKGSLPAVTHNKAIQKARESYRLTPEQKEAIKALKRK